MLFYLRRLLINSLTIFLLFSTATYSVELTQAERNDIAAKLIPVISLLLSDGIVHNGSSYKKVTSPYTGRVWLDRNLGASRVCTSSDDSACYGDYYQWGRNFDGHQKSTSTVTNTQATNVNAVGSSFIIGYLDWTTADGDGSLRSANWSKTNGSSVCPTGFRVPTLTELKAETIDKGVTNSATAFSNFLKLPTVGYRDYHSDSLLDKDLWGYLWTSSLSSSQSNFVYFDSSRSGTTANSRAYGLSVRCIAGGVVHKGKVYYPVTSPYTGKVWLDRNLGASRVCTALNDTQCYGDYYQWGRNADGHEKSTSTTTTTLSPTLNTAGNNQFIINAASTQDWVGSGVDDDGSLRSANWSKTDGSSVCPAGYRVPTAVELAYETRLASTSVFYNTEAFDNFLKLPSAGFRSNYSDSFFGQGSQVYVWTSSAIHSFLNFSDTVGILLEFSYAVGYSVRCIKN